MDNQQADVWGMEKGFFLKTTKGNNSTSVIPLHPYCYFPQAAQSQANPQCRPCAPMKLSFGELELGSCAFLTVFLALFDSRVAGEET